MPVLGMIMDMLVQANVDIQEKVVVELGPGQTPDMLYSALVFGASRAVGLDIREYLDEKISLVDNYVDTIQWINEGVATGQLPRTCAFDENRFADQNVIPDKYLEVMLYDGEHFPLEDESVDIIWSKSVLEHVKDYLDLIKEMRRVLKLGGVMCHIIDLRDHTTFENGKDWLRFLTYGESLWKAMTSNRTTWSNRIRASQWEETLKAAGFHLLYGKTDLLPFHEDFDRQKLVVPFQNLEEKDLRIAWLKVVYQKQPFEL